jgi:putative nucleotidyltransferase with HDIG domain
MICHRQRGMEVSENNLSLNNNVLAGLSDITIDTLPYAVCMVDTEFNILTSNRNFSDLFSDKRAGANRKCYEVFHADGRPPEDCPILKTLRTGNTEQSIIHSSCIDKYLLEITNPIMENGKISRFIHSSIDISALKESEIHHRELIDVYADSLIDMKSREIKAMEVRDAFFNMLEDVNESYHELEDFFLKLVSVMISALDAKSPWTKGHSETVSIYSEQIAVEMSIDDDEIKDIKLAGLLHDIGKIGTYDYLLEKPGKLTREEFSLVMKHPEQGTSILKDINQLENIIPLIKYHHEKLDGSGYPDGLTEKDIPLGARILHVADSFDSMTSDRPYRKAPGVQYAMSELEKYKGTQFDSNVVESFLKVFERSYSGLIDL